MLLWEYTQIAQIIVFAILLTVKGWRVTSCLMLFGVFVYWWIRPQFEIWDTAITATSFVVKAAIDVLFANVLLDYGGNSGRRQSKILVIMTLCHIAMAVLFYTTGSLMYNTIFAIYGKLIVFLNVLQVLVTFDVLWNIIKTFFSGSDHANSIGSVGNRNNNQTNSIKQNKEEKKECA